MAWFSTILKQLTKCADEYIFYENDDAIMLYFLLKGNVSYVLPRYKNASYLEVEVGENFGINDIFVSMLHA